MFQLLGDFVLQTPYWGSAPELRWGTSVPRTSLLCSSKISFKNPLVSLLFILFVHCDDDDWSLGLEDYCFVWAAASQLSTHWSRCSSSNQREVGAREFNWEQNCSEVIQFFSHLAVELPEPIDREGTVISSLQRISFGCIVVTRFFAHNSFVRGLLPAPGAPIKSNF